MDGSTLSTDEFWARCAASPVLPETSAPSPGRLPGGLPGRGRRRLRRRALHQPLGRGIGHLPVGRDRGQGRGRPDRGAAVDSRSLTMGLGLMVLDLAERAAAGPPWTSWSTGSTSSSPHPGVRGGRHARPPREGGRIGGARALLGSLLSIKPVVTLVDGGVGKRSRSNGPAAARSATWPTRPGLAAAQPAGRCNGAAPTSTSSWPCWRASSRAPDGGGRPRPGGGHPHRPGHHRRVHGRRPADATAAGRTLPAGHTASRTILAPWIRSPTHRPAPAAGARRRSAICPIRAPTWSTPSSSCSGTRPSAPSPWPPGPSSSASSSSPPRGHRRAAVDHLDPAPHRVRLRRPGLASDLVVGALFVIVGLVAWSRVAPIRRPVRGRGMTESRQVVDRRFRAGRAHGRHLLLEGPARTAGHRRRALVDQRPAGRQLMLTTEVENFPGFVDGIMGPELMQAFRDQAARFGAEYVTAKVSRVDLSAGPFGIWVGDPDADGAHLRRRGPDHRHRGAVAHAQPAQRGAAPGLRRVHLCHLRRILLPRAATSPWSAVATRPSKRRCSSPASPTRSPSSTAAASCGPRRSCSNGPSPTPRSPSAGTPRSSTSWARPR